jgi:hypothetical protein
MEVQVIADEEGRFTLPGLKLGDPEGRVQVVPPDGSPYHRLEVSVPDGAAERGNFDLKLTRGVPVTVKIIDKATGKPVKATLTYNVFPDDNPNVALVPNIWHEHHWHDSRTRFDQSATELRIVVFPGKGLLAASADRSVDYLTGVGAEEFPKRRTDTPWLSPYYPVPRLQGLAGGPWNSLPLNSYNRFAEINVPADAKEFSATLEVDPGLAVTGRLVDAQGRPVVGAKGYGLSPSFTGWGWTKPAAEATFAVTVLRPDEARRVLFVHTARKLAGSVVVGGKKEPVEVVLEPWGVVTGRLVDTDGKPVTRALGRELRVGGDPDAGSGGSEFWYPVRKGSLGSDGRFRITGLAPGLTYHLYAAGGASRREGRWNVGSVAPKAGETTDLGDVVLR